jgi:sugar (pentulose or hexulose) kinase
LPAISDNIEKIIQTYISKNDDRYAEFDRLTGLSKPGAGGLCINPIDKYEHLCLGGHSRTDIARALMEGAAEALKDKLSVLDYLDINPSSAVMVGGPSESLVWPGIVSDVLGIPVSTFQGSWAGAVGAAMIAKRSISI